MDDYYIIIITI